MPTSFISKAKKKKEKKTFLNQRDRMLGKLNQLWNVGWTSPLFPLHFFFFLNFIFFFLLNSRLFLWRCTVKPFDCNSSHALIQSPLSGKKGLLCISPDKPLKVKQATHYLSPLHFSICDELRLPAASPVVRGLLIACESRWGDSIDSEAD